MHKVKSGLWTWLIVVTVLSVAGFAATLFVSWMATRTADAAWNACDDELRAAGEPLTLADIEQKRPRIAADKNAAMLIRNLEPLLAPIDAEDQTQILYFSDDLKTLDLSAGVPANVLEKSRWFLENHADVLAAAAPLVHLSQGRSSTNFSEVTEDPFDAQLPSLESWRELARLFQLRATIALIDGDITSVVHSFRCLIDTGASLEHEPNLIPRLVQIAVHCRGS